MPYNPPPQMYPALVIGDPVEVFTPGRSTVDVSPPTEHVPPQRVGYLPDVRKGTPIATGVIDYFPDALVEIARLSKVGNDQHNPGKPLHWDRTKSQDEADALMRHFIERGTLDVDGIRHSTKVAWRALAMLQKEIEASRKGGGA